MMLRPHNTSTMNRLRSQPGSENAMVMNSKGRAKSVSFPKSNAENTLGNKKNANFSKTPKKSGTSSRRALGDISNRKKGTDRQGNYSSKNQKLSEQKKSLVPSSYKKQQRKSSNKNYQSDEKSRLRSKNKVSILTADEGDDAE